MADRVVVMRSGLIQQIGPPDEVYRRPANRFVASFVGSPPMNILEGRIETAGGRRTLRRPDPGRRAGPRRLAGRGRSGGDRDPLRGARC